MLESPFAFLRESGSDQSAGMHCKAENWVVTALITSSSLLDCTTASTGQMGALIGLLSADASSQMLIAR
jgi:hypothetical protein